MRPDKSERYAVAQAVFDRENLPIRARTARSVEHVLSGSD